MINDGLRGGNDYSTLDKIILLAIKWIWLRNRYYMWNGNSNYSEIILSTSYRVHIFCNTCSFSLSTTIIATLLIEETNKNILINFYKTIRPFGFW